MVTLLRSFKQFSNQDLLREVARLAAREREATARLIASLAELDRRGLYLAEGCASLFAYCVGVLHLPEHAAYDRIEVARAARRFPVILTQLAAGAVTLTTVRLLAPHLTEQNHAALLAEARHRTRREVEQIVARLQPRPDVPSTIRKLPTPPPAPRPPDTPLLPNGSVNPAQADARATPIHATPPAPLPTAPPTRPAVVAPLAPTRYKVSFTISAETYAKLQDAQALLRHVIPSGDLALIVDRALTLLVADCGRRKHAATSKPRPDSLATLRQAQGRLEQSREPTAPKAPSSRTPGDAAQGAPASAAEAPERATPTRARHVPAEVRRKVWHRDGGQCAFVSASGRRCAQRGFLEFHHVVPYAKGGGASAENIQLRCRAHNGYEAERDFGPWSRCVRETAPVFGGRRRQLGLKRVWHPLCAMPLGCARGRAEPVVLRRAHHPEQSTNIGFMPHDGPECRATPHIPTVCVAVMKAHQRSADVTVCIRSGRHSQGPFDWTFSRCDLRHDARGQH